jgi:hypothetical protein
MHRTGSSGAKRADAPLYTTDAEPGNLTMVNLPAP